jgi:Flp pilus assembly protein TadD
MRLLGICAAAALGLAGCSQNGWFLAKSADPSPSGSDDPTCDTGASPAQRSSGAADLKNPLTMARLFGSRGQTAEAKRLYEEMIQRHPKDPAGYHGLALLYAKQGQFKEAEPCFTRALALAPDEADLLGDMGYFCYLCSRSQEAERYLRRAMELEPNQATYGNNLALVLGEQGRDKESLDLFRRFGTEERAYANMAFVYAQRGDYAKALETYNRVLTGDPKDRTAAMAMLQVSKLQDQRQRAGPQIAGQSPQPLEVPNPVAPASATPAADKALARATPSDLPGDGGLKPALRPAAEGCTPVSAEVDPADEETSPSSEVRWPEGALDVERLPAVVQ